MLDALKYRLNPLIELKGNCITLMEIYRAKCTS
jgi:hypothetical protein